MNGCKDVPSCCQLMLIDYSGLNRVYIAFNRLMLSWIWYPHWSRINRISLLKILTLRILLMSRVLWEDLFIFCVQMTLTNSIWYVDQCFWMLVLSELSDRALFTIQEFSVAGSWDITALALQTQKTLHMTPLMVVWNVVYLEKQART